MTPERLAEIKARAEAATPGPWEWAGLTVEEDGYLGDTLITLGDHYEGHGEDMDFIAHARQDIPELLAEVERLRAALAAADRTKETANG